MITFRKLLTNARVLNTSAGRLLSTPKVQPSFPKSKIESSLYFSDRDEIFSVAQPAFTADYLRDVAGRLPQILENMKLRNMNQTKFQPMDELRKDLLEFADETAKMKKIKQKRKKLRGLKKKRPEDKTIDTEFQVMMDNLNSVRQRFYALEDRIVSFLLALPAAIDLEQAGKAVAESKGSLDKETASRLGPVNYLRLGYFNHALHPSTVGPDAHFFTQEGAETFHALTDYFLERFESHNFEPLSGMDLVKSAIVEAVNSKSVSEDVFQLNSSDPDETQALHLAGDGSLAALVSTFLNDKELKAARFVQTGSSYNDEKSQTHVVSATILEHSDKLQEAQKELYELWWSILNQIGFRCRSFYCPVEQLKVNESSKLVISVWLYSKREWITVVELINHGTNIFRRVGLETGGLSLLHSQIDLLPLIRCWLEHFQDPNTGKVSRPEALKSFYISQQ